MTSRNKVTPLTRAHDEFVAALWDARQAFDEFLNNAPEPNQTLSAVTSALANAIRVVTAAGAYGHILPVQDQTKKVAAIGRKLSTLQREVLRIIDHDLNGVAIGWGDVIKRAHFREVGSAPEALRRRGYIAIDEDGIGIVLTDLGREALRKAGITVKSSLKDEPCTQT